MAVADGGPARGKTTRKSCESTEPGSGLCTATLAVVTGTAAAGTINVMVLGAVRVPPDIAPRMIPIAPGTNLSPIMVTVMESVCVVALTAKTTGTGFRSCTV